MEMKLHRNFLLTLTGLFFLLATLACIGLMNNDKDDTNYNQYFSSEEEEIRRLITEITIQRLELNAAFDRYLEACLNKIRSGKQDHFEYKNVNQFLLYDLELQHRFHNEIRNTLSTNFTPGKQLELVNEQLRNSEKEVEYFEKHLVLESGISNVQLAEKLKLVLKEIRDKKIVLQQKLKALLTGIKYTENRSDLKKSSQNNLLIFFMILLTGAGFGIILSYTYFRNNCIPSTTQHQLQGSVIRIVQGEPVPESKENGMKL